jgi:3-oxoacyl-[acyl-carrier protein] reductase
MALGSSLGEEARVENLKKVVAGIPMGRLAAHMDIANTAVWLASEEASFITGIEVPVDGGRSI